MDITLIFYVVTSYTKYRIRFNKDNVTMGIFGFIAGVIGGVTNAIVVFLMIYLFDTDCSKHEMVIVNNISILITKVIQIVMLTPVIIGFDNKKMWLLGVVIFIQLFFVYIGSYIRNRLPQAVFNHAIAVMLMGLGVYAL